MPPLVIDPKVLADNLKADADVIRSLRENGDVPSIVRPILLLFVGEPAKIDRLHDKLVKAGWRITGLFSREDGNASVEVQRDQTTDEEAIRALTKMALAIAAEAGVDYDGWGAIAQRAQ